MEGYRGLRNRHCPDQGFLLSLSPERSTKPTTMARLSLALLPALLCFLCARPALAQAFDLQTLAELHESGDASGAYEYRAAMSSAYLSLMTLRLTFIVGVSSFPSTENSTGNTLIFLMVWYLATLVLQSASTRF